MNSQATVYLIDDEPDMVELLTDVVELVGLKVAGFTRANEFFDQVKIFARGSILMLDLNMPEMDGIEVMRRLAGMPNPPAIILLSGHDSGVLHSAEKLCVAHKLKLIASLSKPLSIGNLCELLIQYNGGEAGAQKKEVVLNKIRITAEELQKAIEDKQLILHYQPQIILADGKLSGVEALVRWQHPRHGLIYPDSFIQVAEKNNLIGALTQCVIETVVKQEKEWQKKALEITVSVNISAENITSLALPEQLGQLLKDNQLDPTRLMLEITESALMGELVTSLDILTRLRLKGLHLSIDDFGTGFSSLSQLHRVPFTELKIDQSFVSNLSADDEARAIVKTCIMLGHELNMKVVAEGVEDEATLKLLQQMGCDVAQGYFISRPVSADVLVDWINLNT